MFSIHGPRTRSNKFCLFSYFTILNEWFIAYEIIIYSRLHIFASYYFIEMLRHFRRVHVFQMILVAQCMPQFSGGPVQFMTYDDMEYKRGDGWFLSYTKIAGIIVVFIIGVIAAGFLGWYINSLPKKKVSNS